MKDVLRILLPGERYILASGEWVIVRPVPFGKLWIFYESFASLMQRKEEAGIGLEDIPEWKTFFEVFREEITDLMSLPIHKPREYINSIGFDDRLNIFITIIEQNFKEKKRPPKTEEDSIEVSWVDAIQVLISNGHRWLDIRDEYTLEMIELFLKCIMRSEDQRRRNLVLDLSIAGRGSGEDIKKHINALQPKKELVGDREELLKDHGKS